MSTVEKLLIKGIRSFSPDNTAVIEFYKPLTLIVGANGAGKTTIIECLKQACTGELPPNTRSGQSFIHDPKVSNETETKAQIKLRFKNSCGMPVVVLRSFQLTQKAKQMQFKTLDCTVQAIDKVTGEKQALTYRCGDLDKLVPEMMGVSKAVLENVIFVHQEESNWPLSEGKVLKERFDDIFSATKYTKALEALRKMRSEKVQEAKELKLRLDTVKTHRDVSLRLRREVTEGKERTRGLEENMRALEGQIQEKKAAILAVDEKLARISQIDAELNRLRAQRGEKIAQVDQALSRLKEGDYDEPTDKLLEYVQQFDAEAANREAAVQGQKRKIFDTKEAGEKLKRQYQQDTMSHARLVAEAAAHTNNVAARDGFIRTTASKLGIFIADAPDVPLGLPSVQAFQAELATKQKALEAALAELKATNRSKDDSMGSALDHLNAQMAAATEGLRTRKEQLARNEKTIEAQHSEIQSYPVSSAMVEAARVREKDTLGAWERSQGEQASSHLDTALAREREALDDIQRKMNALRSERDRVASASEGATRLAMQRKDALDKEQALENLLLSKRTRLLHLLRANDLPPVERLREAADRALSERKAEVSRRRATMDELQRKHQTMSGQLSSARTQLTAANTSLDTLRRELRDGMKAAKGGDTLGEDMFAQEYSRAETASTSLLQKMSLGRAMTTVLERYRQVAAGHVGCPLCQRPFQEGEREACIRVIDSELETLPATLASRQATLERAKAEVAALQALQPKWVRFSDLRDRELPAARDNLSRLEREVEDLSQQVDEAHQEFALIDSELSDAQRLVTEVVWQVDRQHKELAELNNQVRRLEVASGASGGGGRTVADVDHELQELEAQRAQHDAALDGVQRRRERLANDVMAAAQAHTVAQNERAALEDKFRRKEACIAKIQELEATNAELAQQIRSASDVQQPLVAERDKLLREREAMRAESSRQEAAAEAALREAVTLADQYADKCRMVDKYVSSGGAQQLQQVSVAIEQLKARLDVNQQQLQELDAAHRSAEKEATQSEVIRRELRDVLDYRQAKESLDHLGAEIAACEARVAQVGDHALLLSQLSAVEGEAKDLRTRQDMLRGQVAAVDAAIGRANKELSAAVYKDIDEEYRSKLIELTAVQMGNSDLDIYHKALEKALLTFHTTKMEDINKIIKEMWQKTYRGQDIDHIQIKADADGARSYNYRVVMYSGGAELEMRGRCSAGQKVLACLIIRLALAETFCLNCGILALDEPTTNLDVENSQALAEELRGIMVARKDQTNFQLIVITHDEAFAHSIGTHEYADTMWRITKDDMQHTKVTSEVID